MVWQPVDERTYLSHISAELPSPAETFSTPGYHQPGSPKNGLAGFALALSILGVMTFGLLTIFGIIMGHVAAHKSKARGNIARAAYRLGYTVLAWWGVTILLFYTLNRFPPAVVF